MNEPLLIVYSDGSGARLHDLTDRTARGRLVFHKEIITTYVDLLTASPRVVLRSGVNYCRYSFHGGIWPPLQIRSVAPATSRLIVAACLLPGAVAYLRDLVSAR